MFTLTNIQISQNEKSIVLVGFMGVGKTTIGSLVAQKLKWLFIDIDEEIEKEYGMSINQIFEVHGEKKFREMEKEKIRSTCEKPSQVVSLGGGAFMQSEVREVCLANCCVLYLNMSWEKWKERLDELIDSRPLLREKDLKEIEELFYKRQEAYTKNHATINVNTKTPEEAAECVIQQSRQSPTALKR